MGIHCKHTLCAERKEQRRALRKGWGTHGMVRNRKNEEGWATRHPRHGEGQKRRAESVGHPAPTSAPGAPRSQRMGHGVVRDRNEEPKAGAAGSRPFFLEAHPVSSLVRGPILYYRRVIRDQGSRGNFDLIRQKSSNRWLITCDLWLAFQLIDILDGMLNRKNRNARKWSECPLFYILFRGLDKYIWCA